MFLSRVIPTGARRFRSLRKSTAASRGCFQSSSTLLNIFPLSEHNSIISSWKPQRGRGSLGSKFALGDYQQRPELSFSDSILPPSPAELLPALPAPFLCPLAFFTHPCHPFPPLPDTFVSFPCPSHPSIVLHSLTHPSPIFKHQNFFFYSLLLPFLASFSLTLLCFVLLFFLLYLAFLCRSCQSFFLSS